MYANCIWYYFYYILWSDSVNACVGYFSPISIHAPAKGATTTFTDWMNGVYNFNPRSRKGSDAITVKILYVVIAFQSTLPQRERRESVNAARLPRVISIHAPAKGATQSY